MSNDLTCARVLRENTSLLVRELKGIKLIICSAEQNSSMTVLISLLLDWSPFVEVVNGLGLRPLLLFFV